MISLLKTIANNSSCVKYKVGAVAFRDKDILCSGYNTAIYGGIKCYDANGHLDMDNDEHRKIHREWSEQFEIHAEMNLICESVSRGISLEHATVVCSYSPCSNCLKHMIQAGVSCVIYVKKYAKSPDFSLYPQIIIKQFHEN